MFTRRSRWRLVIFFILALLLMALLFVLFPNRAGAAGGGITISNQAGSVDFPKSMTFTISVQDDTSIVNDAHLHLDINRHDSTEDIPVKIAALDHREELSDQEDISGIHYLATGSQVIYYWTLVDEASHTLTTPSKTLTVTDTRFNWSSLTADQVTVHWYNRDQAFGQMLLDTAGGDVKKTTHGLGGTRLGHQIDVWVYSQIDDFKGSLKPGSYEWIGGEARPDLNAGFFVVEDENDLNLKRTMPHELTHLVLHQLTHNIMIPIWFDEGMAVYNQQYHEQSLEVHFQQALKSQSLIPLKDFSYSYPRDNMKANEAYAQSWKLMDYMYKRFGQDKMSELVTKLGRSDVTDFDTVYKTVFHEDVAHLENDWHLSLHQPATLTNTASTETQPQSLVQTGMDTTTMLLLVLGVALVMGAIVLIVVVLVMQSQKNQKEMAAQSTNQMFYQHPSAYPMPQQNYHYAHSEGYRPIEQSQVPRSEHSRVENYPPQE